MPGRAFVGALASGRGFYAFVRADGAAFALGFGLPAGKILAADSR